MVIIEQFRISDDGLQMYIDAHVNKSEGFEDVYIKYVGIRTADKTLEMTTADSFEPQDTLCYYKEYAEGQKEIHLTLEPKDFNLLFTKTNFSDDLFFLHIKTEGALSPECAECYPCDMQSEVTTSTTFDIQMLYQKVMNYTKELAISCNIPKDFVNLILLWNGFNASVETEHYVSAIKFYNMLFSPEGSSIGTPVRKCGCQKY